MSHKTRSMSDTEPALKVDPSLVACGYLLYPRTLSDMIQSGKVNPHQALETNQPRFWPSVRNHDPQIIVHLIMAMPTVEISGLGAALSEVGFFEGYNITVGDMKFSLDGGATMEQMFVGFCWPSTEPEIIVVRPDGVISGKGRPFWKLW